MPLRQLRRRRNIRLPFRRRAIDQTIRDCLQGSLRLECDSGQRRENGRMALFLRLRRILPGFLRALSLLVLGTSF